MWVQNDSRLDSRLSDLKGDAGNRNVLFSSSVILRRSFLLKKSNSRMPVGVMGKVLSSMFYWGRIQRVWRTGCVVKCDCGNDDVVVAMWEKWCGARVGIHFVFHVNKRLY